MSTPKIVGFRGSTPYDWLKVLNTTDDRAFNLGVVVPGTSKANYECYWFNLGPAQLHDPQLSLVPHPTLDAGDNEDTIDVMKLGASGSDLLGFSTPAKATNTAGWETPLPDPLLPWSNVFRCGISWHPGPTANPGIIRKAFQWDGGYYPDTWDYMWAPLANQAFPQDSDYDYPFTVKEGPGTHHQKIEADPGTITGYRLNLWNPTDPSDYIYYEHQSTPGNPWYDNVDNSKGYIIKTKCKWDGGGEGYPAGFEVADGDYIYRVRWNRDGSTFKIVCLASEGFATTKEVLINSEYREVLIKVKGSSLKIYVDGTLGIDATLNTSEGDKSIGWGMLAKPPAGQHWGAWFVQYVKYYCGGDTEPIY